MEERKATTHTIPAAPGYQAFQWEVRDGVVDIMTSSVIAWRLISSGSGLDEHTIGVDPLTDDNLKLRGVIRPDGTVFIVEDRWFDSIDAFKAAVLGGEVWVEQ